MRDFWKKINYLLDQNDRKEFVKFVFLLLISGFIASLGLTTLVLSIKGLADPQFILKIPIIKNFSYKHVVVIAITLLIAYIWGKGALSIFITKKRSFFINNMITKIQKKLFFAYLHSPYFTHIKRNTSELVNNIKGESTVLSEILANFARVLSLSLTAIILIIIVLIISPLFAIGILIPIFFSNKLLMKIINAKSQKNAELRGKSHAEFSKVTTYGLTGFKEIKIYQKENFFIDTAEKNAKIFAQCEISSAVLGEYFGVLNESIPLSILFLIILNLLISNHNGTQLLVSLAIFGIMAAQLIPCLEKIMRSISNIKYQYFALDKIYSELKSFAIYQDQFSADKESQSNIFFHEAIKLKNVSFKYDEKPVLKNISLTIHKGKKIAFVGHSGAGKTTLVDIILGILTPSSGEIQVDDTFLTQNNMSSWYRHFGYIPQMIYVLDSSIRENIALGMEREKIDDEQVWRCLEIASLAAFVEEQCPHGLDTIIGDNGIRLSGGQRQRIGIARALYSNPDILVMDEATAALDNQTEHDVSQALTQASKNRTTITIAHRLTTIQHYDIIYLMNMGQIIASGSYQELLSQCEVFQKMLEPKTL